MRVIFCFLVLGMSFSVHSAVHSVARAAEASTVKVGVALRFAPEANSFAPALYQGIEFAKQTFEHEHPELKIELVKYPHKNTHASLEEAAKKIKDDKVVFVMGGEMSDDAFTLAEEFHNHGILLMTPTASNPLLTSGNPLVFRACFSDDQVAKQMAKYVETLSQFHSIGVIHDTDNAYSDYLTNAFLDALGSGAESHAEKSKRQVIEFRYAGEQPDFKGAITQFKKANVDLVVAFTLQDHLKAFYQLASKAQLNPTYVGSDGWGTTDSLQKWVGDDFRGIRNSYWLEDSKDSNVVAFKSGFKKAFNQAPDAWNAVSYDAALSLFEAIAKTKNSSDVNEVAETLHTMTFKKAVTSKEFKFNSKNTILKPFYLYEIKKSQTKFLKEMKS